MQATACPASEEESASTKREYFGQEAKLPNRSMESEQSTVKQRRVPGVGWAQSTFAPGVGEIHCPAIMYTGGSTCKAGDNDAVATSALSADIRAKRKANN
ncbi:hypothetical protein NDU88_003967 [Pleurodeles waltl]|uniref:Uncharacterized protein n=1 Tax=Pleurodeles waltl TaxID=8319 RepID=A0AAV7TR84_PLEWA|nr:hypothetical protein NDU88_003966 [Pleurodeles waltl]KAJ1178725.1 hypothetical protein NDU88_003967 [Pleurodeles waltl]